MYSGKIVVTINTRPDGKIEGVEAQHDGTPMSDEHTYSVLQQVDWYLQNPKDYEDNG